MKSILTFILIIGVSFVSAQKTGQSLIDSLLIELSRKKNDTTKINVLNKLSKAYDGINPDEGIKIANSVISLSTNLNWPKGTGDANNNLGILYSNSGKFNDALKFHNTALVIRKKINDFKGVAESYSNLGVIATYQHQLESALKYCDSSLLISLQNKDSLRAGMTLNTIAAIYQYKGNDSALMKYNQALEIFLRYNYEKGISAVLGNTAVLYTEKGEISKALSNYFSALRIDEKNNDLTGIALNCNHIATLYKYQKDYINANIYFERALNIYKYQKDKNGEADVYAELADVYNRKDSFNLALNLYEKSLIIHKELGNERSVDKTLAGIGTTYINLKKYKLALEYLLKSYDKFLKEKDSTNISYMGINIGRAYYELNKYTDALVYTKLTLRIGQKVGNIEITRDANELLSNIYAHKGDYRQAYNFYTAFIKNRDSTLNLENQRRITQAQLQYDFDKKELLSKAEHEKQLAITKAANKAKLRISTIIGSALLLLSFVSFYFYRKRQSDKFKIQLAKLKQEALNAQMNDHFIFNTISSINNFIRINDKQKASDYLIRFSNLIRQVIINSKSSTVPIKDDLGVLNDFIEIEKLRFDGILELNTEIDSEIDTIETFIRQMVFQTLVENSIKHAFTGLKKGVIKITVNKQNQFLSCKVEDNGNGREQSNFEEKSHKSFGLGLAVELVRTAHKSFKDVHFEIVDLKNEYDLGSGTRVSFVLPIINNA